MCVAETWLILTWPALSLPLWGISSLAWISTNSVLIMVGWQESFLEKLFACCLTHASCSYQPTQKDRLKRTYLESRIHSHSHSPHPQTHAHMHAYTCMQTCMHVGVCMYTCIHTQIFTHIDAWLCMHMHACTYTRFPLSVSPPLSVFLAFFLLFVYFHVSPSLLYWLITA